MRQFVLGGLLFCVFLAAVSLIVLRNMASWAARSYLTSLTAHTRMVGERLVSGEGADSVLAVDRRAVSLLWEIPARWAGLYDRAGRLTAKAPFLPAAQLTPPTLVGPALPGAGEAVAQDLSAEDPPSVRITVALPSGDRLLHVCYDGGILAGARRSVRALSVAVPVAALVLALLVVPFLRRLMRPIEALTETARGAGAVVPGDGAGLRDEADNAIATFARTIDELKKRTHELEELRQSEKERADALAVTAETLVRSHPGGLLVIDPKGVLTDASLPALTALELPRSVLHRPALEVVGGILALEEAIEQAARGIPTLNRDFLLGELQSISTDAPTSVARSLSVTAVPVEDERKSLLGTLVFIEDRTTTSRLQRELSARRELASLGEMSAGIAHEFRNATATILGYARLAAAADEASARERYLAGIRSEAEHISRVTGDFLFFARPERLALVQTSMQVLVQEIVDEESVAAPDTRVDVVGELGEAVVDAPLFRRALVNLLRNAREAAAAGGRTPRIIVRGDGIQDGLLRLSVEDNGDGVPDEALAKVFVPFYSTKESGTGLGLALVAKIATLHGGAVTVDRSPELGGARFVVSVRASTTATWPRLRALK